MRISRIAKYIGVACLSSLMMGCSSHKGQISANTNPKVLVPDEHNEAVLNTEFFIPADYMSSRSRVVIVPQLVVGNEVVQEYEPIVVDGKIFSKKNHRREVLSHYRDPYAKASGKVSTSRSMNVPYQQRIMLPDGVQGGEIVGVVTRDGCGSCTGYDKVEIASLSSIGSLMNLSDMKMAWEQPAFEVVAKEFEGKGEARLQFVVNRSDIDMDLANNRQELNKMLETLRPLIKDSLVTLKSLRIKGAASPEGPYEGNIRLAANRALSAKNWLSDNLALPSSMRNRIIVGSAPEGWEAVVKNMHDAGDPDSLRVLQIIRNYPGANDDLAEAEIRRLPFWQRIVDNYLAKDRKVTYEYAWKVRSFDTDDEMLRMYSTRPDALNEQEFLRVASLTENPAMQKKIYSDMLKYHPTCATAVNNLAIIMAEEGDLEGAKELLENQFRLTPSMRNTLAMIEARSGNVGKAANLFEDVNTTESLYNLGVMNAIQGKYGQAYKYLEDASDLNGAIAALSVGKDKEAWRILSGIKDISPRAEYVRAIAAARLGLVSDALAYLKRAAVDNEFKERAISEPDFKVLKNNPEFNHIVNN